MMLSPEYKAYTEYCFDAFCKKAMRFEVRNCYKAISRKQQREISLDFLMEEYNFEPPSLNDYFVDEPVEDVPTQFHINRQVVTVENERLAAAILRLSKEKRELILLRYFIGVNDTEIAEMYGLARSTINYRKHRSLKLLRQEMEKLEYEEA